MQKQKLIGENLFSEIKFNLDRNKLEGKYLLT